MTIRKSAPTNLVGTPTPTLNKPLFDANVWAYGYDVVVEKAIECPCRQDGSNSNQVNCQNCGGMGWVFINPTRTKAIITSINQDTKYKAWSQELIGNISTTFRDIDQASFMDRITLENESTIYSEVRTIRTSGMGQKFVFLAYKIDTIEDVFLFNGESQPLIRIPSTSYSVNPNNEYILNIDTAAISGSTNGSISVRYRHRVQYNILDIPHVVRSAPDLNNLGQLKKQKMPLQYIARLSHYVLRPNFNNTNIIDNSY